MITIEDFPSLSHPKTQPHLYLTSNPTNKRLLSLCHHTPTNTRVQLHSQTTLRDKCVLPEILISLCVTASQLSQPDASYTCRSHLSDCDAPHAQQQEELAPSASPTIKLPEWPSPWVGSILCPTLDGRLRLLSHSTNCVVVNKWCQLLTPNSTHRVRLTFCRMQLAVLRVASWRFIIQNIKMHKHYIYSTGINSNVCSILCTDFLFLDIDCCQKLSDNASTIKKFNLTMYLPLNWFWLRIFSIASVWLTELFAVLGDWDLLK